VFVGKSSTNHPELIGGLDHEFYDFHSVGNVIIPTGELIFFRGVETTNQINVLLFIAMLDNQRLWAKVNLRDPSAALRTRSSGRRSHGGQEYINMTIYNLG